MTSWFRLTALLLITLLAGLACAPGATPTTDAPAGDATWEKTLEAARKEGKVVVVTHVNEYLREMMPDFEKAYPGIKVEHVAIRPSEFAPKVLAEQQSNLYAYDLWAASTSNMVTVALPAGAFQSTKPFLIRPDVKDGANYHGGKLLWASKQDDFILLERGGVDGTVWVNRDVLPSSQFNSIDQLIDPALKGKITIRTPNAPHGGSLAATGFLNAKGPAFIEKLFIDQQPQYVENARLLTQNLINGKVAIAIGTDGSTLDQCKINGGCKNLEEVKGHPHLLGSGIGVLKNAPNPNAAAVFLQWWMSKEGRESFIKRYVETSPAPFDAAHSMRKDVQNHPDALKAGTIPDYENLSKYSLQGMEQGNDHMETVINIYKKAEATGRR